LKGSDITALFFQFFKTYFPRGHSLKQPEPAIVEKLLPFKEFANGGSLLPREGRRICPRLLKVERKGGKKRQS
jgi:hypothetical protein